MELLRTTVSPQRRMNVAAATHLIQLKNSSVVGSYVCTQYIIISALSSHLYVFIIMGTVC